MSALTLSFRGSQNVRVFGTAESPIFVAADVCEILGLSKSRDAVARLTNSCKGVPVVVDTLGGPQEVATITEAGVYRLIFKSRKPEAEEFQQWLASDVLPAIRRTGGYGVQVASPALKRAQETIARMQAEAASAALALVKPAATYGTPSPSTGEPRTRLMRSYWTSRWAQNEISRRLVDLDQQQLELGEILEDLREESGRAIA